MIIRGGFNVYPREIEEVLMTHPDVSLAAVIGVPHESHGEEIKAVVILNDGATVTEDELVAWGKEQMAAYKYPRMVEIVGRPADDGDRQDPQARAGPGLDLRGRDLSSACRRLRSPGDGGGRRGVDPPGARLSGGSSMSGEDTWAIIGPIVAGLGVALGFVVVQTSRRG